MQCSSPALQRGSPFFTMPPVDILPKLAFEPSKVEERGWVLLFNAFLTTAVSLIQPPDTRLFRGLQWNIWMLMEGSGFFLDASEISIQALLLVATHGQDISTPSLCWTLISNACRMAQTLALHLPTAHAPKSSEANLQRNCLFWSLFITDKSLSLSFGRPPLLPGYLYKNVPPPDPTLLAKYRPHQDLDALSSFKKTYHSGSGTRKTPGRDIGLFQHSRDFRSLQDPHVKSRARFLDTGDDKGRRCIYPVHVLSADLCTSPPWYSRAE
jgi:hypothetical protein